MIGLVIDGRTNNDNDDTIYDTIYDTDYDGNGYYNTDESDFDDGNKSATDQWWW